MSEIKIGDRLKDNDPRMGNRVLRVVGVYQWGVCAVDSMGRERDYLMRRIHTDGKPRRGGFDLVRAAAALHPNGGSTQ